MFLVLVSEPVEGDEWEDEVEGVAKLGAHLPGRDLCGVGLSVPVIGTSVKPMAIVVYMEVFQVTELIQRVMLQVMNLYSAKIHD